MTTAPFIDREVNCVNEAKVLQTTVKVIDVIFNPKYTLFNHLCFHLKQRADL